MAKEEQIPNPCGDSVVTGFKTGKRNGIALIEENYKGLHAWHLRHCFWHQEGGWVPTRRGVAVHKSNSSELQALVEEWLNRLKQSGEEGR